MKGGICDRLSGELVASLRKRFEPFLAAQREAALRAKARLET
jgi:hypothetical protein